MEKNRIWDCNIFLQETTKTWGQRAAGWKTYDNAVTCFNNKITGIELYEAATGNKSGQNSFSQANAVQELTATVVTSLEGFKVENVSELRKRDMVITNTVTKFRNGQSELRGQLAKLETSLATIAASLATISYLNKHSRIVEEIKNHPRA